MSEERDGVVLLGTRWSEHGTEHRFRRRHDELNLVVYAHDGEQAWSEALAGFEEYDAAPEWLKDDQRTLIGIHSLFGGGRVIGVDYEKRELTIEAVTAVGRGWPITPTRWKVQR